ncbi:MAG: hypothetical protein JHC33_03220, partial [Ignisphaera sp.]|nr:hypothetical protein [Ignisphaera sp.]
MPRGIERKPKMTVPTKLTAVTMSCNGRKVQTFIMLPIINEKAVLPMETADQIMDDLGAE